mmetsp:Transcript_104553/g.312254  ORF Transcript_104553/g.312254 Transcript_104553/m.312254 type:complete len:381 (+) Transcript_104553:165-1307(+)
MCCRDRRKGVASLRGVREGGHRLQHHLLLGFGSIRSPAPRAVEDRRCVQWDGLLPVEEDPGQHPRLGPQRVRAGGGHHGRRGLLRVYARRLRHASPPGDHLDRPRRAHLRSGPGPRRAHGHPGQRPLGPGICLLFPVGGGQEGEAEGAGGAAQDQRGEGEGAAAAHRGGHHDRYAAAEVAATPPPLRHAELQPQPRPGAGGYRHAERPGEPDLDPLHWSGAPGRQGGEGHGPQHLQLRVQRQCLRKKRRPGGRRRGRERPAQRGAGERAQSWRRRVRRAPAPLAVRSLEQELLPQLVSSLGEVEEAGGASRGQGAHCLRRVAPARGDAGAHHHLLRAARAARVIRLDRTEAPHQGPRLDPGGHQQVRRELLQRNAAAARG